MTLKLLASLEESDEDEEDDGTAKITKPRLSDRPQSEVTPNPSRLSSMFENWFIPASVASPTQKDLNPRSGNRMSVSEPKLVEHSTGSSLLQSDHVVPSDNEDIPEAAFEEMMVTSMCACLPRF